MNNRIFSDIGQQPSNDPSANEQLGELVGRYRAEPEQQLPQGFFFQEDQLMWSANSDGNRAPRAPIFVCSRLDVVAIVRDKNGNNHGRLLEFRDADGNLKRWAMPMDMLAGEGVQYRSELLSRGLTINCSKTGHALLSTYLNQTAPAARVTFVDCIGWHDNCFVLPDVIFGKPAGETIVLQDVCKAHSIYTCRGRLDDWKASIAQKCRGNPLLMFAVSSAFAPPLAYPLGLEGGGFHFYGRSSTGKTTLVRVAASVWGGEQCVESWRATVNGLEGTAMLHNGTLLCLDEISQMQPGQAGEAAYLLANGVGKGRSNVNCGRRKISRWLLLFLSTGEKTLEQCMREANIKIQAGQEVRVVDLPVSFGRYGVFDNLHGAASGKEFAEMLNHSVKQFYGVACREFLAILVANIDTLKESIKSTYEKFVADNLPPGSDGQVGRVLNRFALVAVAGELATKFGITGWGLSESLDAARTCFQYWLQERGGVSAREEIKIVEHVRLFFEQHGDSRFAPFGVEHSEMSKTINRAGFRKYGPDGEEFYMFVENFKQELCKGSDPSYVARVCIRHGLLIPSSDGKVTRSEKLPGKLENTRCYRFSPRVLGVDESNSIEPSA